MKEQSVEDLNFCIRDLNMIHKRLNKIIKHERYDSTDLVKDLSEYKDFIFIRLCGLNGIIIKYKALSEPAESPSLDIGVDSQLKKIRNCFPISPSQVFLLKNTLRQSPKSAKELFSKFNISKCEDMPASEMDDALIFLGAKWLKEKDI